MFPTLRSIVGPRIRAAAILLAALVCRDAFAAVPAGVATNVLPTALDVRQLTSDQAQKGQPVHLEGIVTLVPEGRDVLVVQDQTGGVAVQVPEGIVLPPEIILGSRIEIEGKTAAGGFAPVVTAPRFRYLGTGQLPVPDRFSFNDVITGKEECQWVELSGVFRWANIIADKVPVAQFHVATEGGRVVARIWDFKGESLDHLVDARVRIRGVCFTVYNERRQVTGMRIEVPGLEHLVVEDQPRSEVLRQPARSISSLLQFNPREAAGRRVKVQGVLTFQHMWQRYYIRSQGQALLVQSQLSQDLKPGDLVEVLGFPALGEMAPVLEDAVLNKIGRASEPEPVRLTAEEAVRGRYQSELVRIEARLVEQMRAPEGKILVLQSSNVLFTARVTTIDTWDRVEQLRDGSGLALTGICVARGGSSTALGRRPDSFQLMLRRPEDIVVLREASWWTRSRILGAMGISLGSGLMALAWVVVLRRRVLQQMRIIEQKLAQETVSHERARMARELHDSLEQSLVAITMQLNAAMSNVEETPHEALRALNVVKGMVRHSQAEARRSVWDLRSEALQKGDISGALREFSGQVSYDLGTPISFSVTGTPQMLPSMTANHLVRIAQEAITNAIKHAQARRILVELHFSESQVQLRVADDGKGFDRSDFDVPAHLHFGLLGMRERAGKIGARLEINTPPGGGTEILVTVGSVAEPHPQPQVVEHAV